MHVQSTRHIGYSNQIEKCTSLSPTACPTDTGFETDTNLVQTATGTLVGKNPSGTAKVYWLASRNGNSGSPTNYGGRYVNASGSVRHNTLANSDGNENSGSHAVRPIVTLKSTVEIISGDGQSEGTAYQLS